MPLSPKVVDLFPTTAEGGRWPTKAEALRKWNAGKPRLMALARVGESFAWSYRRFRPARYGAALLVCRCGRTEEERFGVVWAGNYTIKKRAPDEPLPKPCAERHAWWHAQAMGFGMGEPPRWLRPIVGAVVYSNNMQADDESEVLCNVQHFCGPCRRLLAPLMLPDAPIVFFRDRHVCDFLCAGDEHHTVEEMTFAESCITHKFQL